MRKSLFYFLLLFTLTGCVQQQAGTDNKVLLISFDGFRYDYLSKAPTPNFDKLAEQGVLSDGLIPIFPSKTFPNHYAIATGLYPENNGFVGNSMYDPEMDAYFAIRDRDAVENPDWYEGEPIWNTVEKAGKKAGTMFWVGSEAPIQNMRPSHWKIFDDSVPDSARIDTVLKWMSAGSGNDVDFATLYYSFVDTQGHRFGPNSPRVKEAIQRADDLMGYILEELERLKLANQTNIIVVSDHGMSEISRERIVVLDDYINPDLLQIISTSPALMANVKDDKLEEVYQALKENEENFRVYKKEDIPERFHLKNHRRILDLLLLADLGYTINTKSFFEARPNYPSGGTHGFDNKEQEMYGLFIASGPGFKENYQARSFENIHIYSLMAHLMGIEPAQNDGNIDSVSVFLKEQ